MLLGGYITSLYEWLKNEWMAGIFINIVRNMVCNIHNQKKSQKRDVLDKFVYYAFWIDRAIICT